MACVVQERWGDLDSPLDQLDAGAGHGSALAKAVATAARGEMVDGPARASSHQELRTLGYLGLSEVLAFRSPASKLP